MCPTETVVALDNHRVARLDTEQGPVWACRFCPGRWPYPAPVPADAAPCVPRLP